MLAALTEDGVAIVVEPALRTAARSLHRVRDAILASGAARVFAPCVRQGPCPALDRESDWCHEDRAWDPPERVAEIARLAGVRRGSLKFAYVTFVLDRANVASTRPGEAPAYRVVSDVLVSKGKSEAFLCGDAGRLRAIRLNRDRSEANAAFADLRRGDVARIGGLDPARPRIGATTVVPGD
jgi:ribosomal protein RSM22 (predicted rRNA methylase)